ncbi:hypothetical protein ZIOFF_023361 [Zingiber officinale]|uniref:Myb/SANT-like domain-containing protein n=1 Tax=Zingiber officinale TaxID=94328 RepID=A0A8J5H670_ZINOF|nr:hypothetical protein ZIOFF_023361 [Zingiber officinale]
MEEKSEKMSKVVEQVESSMPLKFKRKTQRTKQLWTKQEDAALVDCLVEYKLMKRQFHAINEMLNHSSGFGWSDVEKCIITTKDVFDDWVKSHPTDIGLRNKEFPHLDDLMFVWGKDRAT